MSWDIYGVPLRRGQCKVHPYVHEGYPCSVCIADKRLSDQQGGYEHLLGLAQEHIKELEHQRDALAAHVERLQQGLRRCASLLHCNFPTTDKDKAHRDAVASLKDKPETSLARLKAQWQADAVSEFAYHHLGGYVKEVAEIYANRLRHQPGGGEI